MIVALSPYHLTTREAPAMAALLLADSVVTMIPAPFGGADRGAVESAAARIRPYLYALESWRWTMPLWTGGVIGSTFEGQDAAEDVREVCRRIEIDEECAPLRPLMRQGVFEEEEGYLEAISRDLLKGGPDPGISIPVAAGLDRFASRHGLLVARSEPISLVQRSEARMGTRLFSLAAPVLVQASGEVIEAARELLEPELVPLREAIDAASTGEDVEALGEAARNYAEAFESQREDLLALAEDDEVRAIMGSVVITGLALPPDAVLRSSLMAMRAVPGGRVPVGAPASASTAIIEGGEVRTIIVKVLGRSGRMR